ncbi:MAG TPA: amino acid adenylation domain-containing protein, partial [Chloroflexia bacterium]|nr:amino acid adenylation domain-containing protein [Chloroflexia bacterium]
KITLYKYTNNPAIIVGSPSRRDDSIAPQLANAVTLVDLIDGQLSFRRLLVNIRETLLEAYARQSYPFERLVSDLGRANVGNKCPLFDISLALSDIHAEMPDVRQDISFTFSKEADHLAGQVAYNKALYRPETIERFSAHLLQVLREGVENTNVLIAELQMLTETERYQLLTEWNRTQADYPRHRCLHELFEEQVVATPGAVAVASNPAPSGEQECLTYTELNRRANQLAHYLRGRGVGPETLVGIYMSRSVRMMVGLLGILKAGGAYVPLDPAYPHERLAAIVEDAAIQVVLSEEALAQAVPTDVSRIICLDKDWPDIAAQSEHNPGRLGTEHNLAYVIYTSGSTGTPKGAMVSHQSLVNYLSWCIGVYRVAEGDGVPIHSPLGFDLTVTSLFAPLLAGQRVILLPDDGGVEALADALYGVGDFSFVKLTPAHLRALSHDPHNSGLAAQAPRVRALVIGGEALTEESLSFWRTHAPGTRLFNEYGPTEATVACSVYEVPATSTEQAGTGPVPIGRPIANTQLYVLDRHLQPVPVGVTGELYIGGAGLARGYLNRPNLTAERFVPNPFASGESAPHSALRTPHSGGERLYRTGDLARYLPDGNLEFLGRNDHQVKIRGFRVELGEIEAILNRHPAVRESVVVARGEVSGEKRLLAYFVPGGRAPSMGELRRFLKKKLPDYMVPSAFVALDALPLTPNGKVDRRALPAPEQERSAPARTFVQPGTPVERALADIWAQVLKVEQVGIHDDYFALGGDSILSIQIIARARQAGIKITTNQVFENPTIAALATVARTAPLAQPEESVATGPVPLTPIQRWFFEQDLLEPHHFNQALMLEAQEPLDAGLLVMSAQRLVEYHPALRLRFAREGKSWQQTVAPSETHPIFAHVDLSAVTPEERAAVLQNAATDLQRSLNLHDGPLMRLALFDMGSDTPALLLLAVHHLAVDGISLRILLEDLQTAYGQLRSGQPSELPPRTAAFSEWADRLAELARSDTFKDEADYWLAAPYTSASPLPIDYPAGIEANTEASATALSAALTVEETQALLYEVPRAYNTQINEVLLTALARTLSAWTGEQRVMVELEGHGRAEMFEDIDLSRTVGWFTAIYPVLLDLHGAGKPGDALKAIKEQLRRVPGGGLGYQVLRYLSEDAALVERIRALPRPQVSFNYLGQFDQAVSGASLFRLSRESGGPTRSPLSARPYLLEIDTLVAGGVFQVQWKYSSAAHRYDTMARLLDDFMEDLRSLIAHCRSASREYTPSDFTLAKLDQSALDKVLAKVKQSQDMQA